MELVPKDELPEWNEEDEKRRLDFEARDKDGKLHLKEWTPEELKGFKEWDEKRKNGEFGEPKSFNTVDELRKWLNE